MTLPYRLLFDKVLTRFDPERAHHGAFAAIRLARPVLSPLPVKAAPVEAMGLTFPHPLGLAAGFDKNAVGIDALAALGFGHVEIGTVTGEPQPGNPRPRLFRLPADRAVINRMGFNNDGAEAVARRLGERAERKRHKPPMVTAGSQDGATSFLGGPVLGVNIGKTKVVPEDEAVGDYEKSTRLLAPYADYLVVNVSSPNTPGLRSLQDAGQLRELLAALRHEATVLAQGNEMPKPVLVKIAPDLTDAAVDELLQVCTDEGVAGLIATNTTIERDGLAPSDAPRAAEAGGLSGRPLTERSRRMVEHVHKQTAGELPVIGVGGILDPDDAARLTDAGASLVQLYTGLVYRGPGLVRRTNSLLAATRGAGR